MKTKKIKTEIIVEADINGFNSLLLPALQHIPSEGERFSLDDRKYPLHNEKIKDAEEKYQTPCHVEYVEHFFTAKTHVIFIGITCRVKPSFL